MHPITGLTLSQPVVTVNCCSSLLMFLGSLLCRQYDPDQTAPLGSSLIRVHIVCFHEKIYSEVYLNICSRSKKQVTFSGQKYCGGIGVKRYTAFCPNPVFINDKNIKTSTLLCQCTGRIFFITDQQQPLSQV